MKRTKFYAKGDGGVSSYLPRLVFSYYSGASDRFPRLFHRTSPVLQKLKDPKAEPNKLPFRPLFLAKATHGQYVLLAFYSHEDKQLRSFLGLISAY